MTIFIFNGLHKSKYKSKYKLMFLYIIIILLAKFRTIFQFSIEYNKFNNRIHYKEYNECNWINDNWNNSIDNSYSYTMIIQQ